MAEKFPTQNFGAEAGPPEEENASLDADTEKAEESQKEAQEEESRKEDIPEKESREEEFVGIPEPPPVRRKEESEQASEEIESEEIELKDHEHEYSEEGAGQAEAGSFNIEKAEVGWEARVNEAQNFEELFSILDEIGPIELKSKEQVVDLHSNEFTRETLENLLLRLAKFLKDKKETNDPLLNEANDIYPVLRMFDQVPEEYGLKAKVNEILNNMMRGQ